MDSFEKRATTTGVFSEDYLTQQRLGEGCLCPRRAARTVRCGGMLWRNPCIFSHQDDTELTILISTMLHIQKPIPKSASWLLVRKLSNTKTLKTPISSTNIEHHPEQYHYRQQFTLFFTIIILHSNLATEPPRLPCSNLPQEPRVNIPPSAMYLTDQSKPSTVPNPHQLYLLYLGTTTSTQIFLPAPTTASSQTLLRTATPVPTSTSMPNPLIPPSRQTFGTDSTMNLIFGLSAFVMAGIAIWQNRHYLRAIKMPWGKAVY